MFQEKQIKNIRENDLVIVSGIVISTTNNGLIIDDNTSRLIVLTDKQFKENDYLRVFGRINNNTLNAEIIQNFNSADKKLHQKVINLLQ